MSRASLRRKQGGFFVPFASGSAKEYEIGKSLRFRASTGAYLTRVFPMTSASAPLTLSFYIQRGSLGAQRLYHAFSGTAWYSTVLEFTAADKLRLYTSYGQSTTLYGWTTTRVFRDTSKPIHIQISIDTRIAGQQSRRLFVNGVEETSFAPEANGYNLLNMDHYICYSGGSGYNAFGGESAGTYFDGYLSEFIAVYGTAHSTVAPFLRYDTATSSWKPRKFTGTFGASGFYLPFNDGSNLTELCRDRSGNGQDWTAKAVSLTAGITYDWMDSTPTDVFCNLNAVNLYNAPTITDANTAITGATAVHRNAMGTLPIVRPIYFEVTQGGVTGASRAGYFGVASTPDAQDHTYPGADANSWGVGYYISTNYIYHAGSGYSVAGTPAAGMVYGVAVDPVSGKIWFSINGGWVSGDPTTGTSPSYSNIPSTVWAIVDAYQTGPHHVNFGQRPFAYAPPAGFGMLHTKNLPVPSVAGRQPHQHFNVLTWVGADAAQPRTLSGLGFQPGLVWAKARSAAYSHQVFDSARGAGLSVAPDTPAAEVPYNSTGYINSFMPGGFSTTNGATNNTMFNNAGVVYAAWNWRAGDTLVANNAGTIPAYLRANTVAGMSVVTYNGSGADGTVGHGLGQAPKLILIKSRGPGTADWIVYHVGLTSAAYYLSLSTDAAQTLGATVFNSTAPTSSVFSVGTSGLTNASGSSYVAYCFAEIPDFSKMGTYLGNGTTLGRFVWCGFKPRFVLIKAVNAAGTTSWAIFDALRNEDNPVELALFAQENYVEGTYASAIDFLAGGFKIRSTISSLNTSGTTYAYYAIAEQPFLYANAR